jgi:hypothetical protein
MHRELRPRLIEHRLLEAQAVDERRQIPSRPPPLRLELLHAEIAALSHAILSSIGLLRLLN